MKSIGDIQFWLITSLNIVAMGLLISSARLKGKEWLLGFLAALVGHFVPGVFAE